MKRFVLASLGITAFALGAAPSIAQSYNGYGSGSYFGGGNTRPSNNTIQKGNGYGSGDYFGMPRTNPSPTYDTPNYRGLGVRDCSKYISC